MARNSALLLRIEEAAELCGVCTRTMYTLTHRADFPTVKIGKRTLISREGLEEWIRKQTQGNQGGIGA